MDGVLRRQTSFNEDEIRALSESSVSIFDIPHSTSIPSLAPSVSTEFTASDVEPLHGSADLQILYDPLPYLIIDCVQASL